MPKLRGSPQTQGYIHQISASRAIYSKIEVTTGNNLVAYLLHAKTLSREQFWLLPCYSYFITFHHFILLKIFKAGQGLNPDPLENREAYPIFSQWISTSLFYEMNYMFNSKENPAPMTPDGFKVAISNICPMDLCIQRRSYTRMLRTTYTSKCLPGLMQVCLVSEESFFLQLIPKTCNQNNQRY